MITYELIREIKQKEKSEKLQPLPENFFRDAVEYIKLKKGSLEERGIKNLVQSIFELRKKKILNIASLSYTTDKIPENLEEDEKELYLGLINLLREYFKNFEKKLNKPSENDNYLEESNLETKPKENLIKKPLEKTKGELENMQKTEPEEKSEANKTKVIFLIDIPEILLPSGKNCSFKKGEEKVLDLGFTKILEEKGFCKQI